MPVKTVRSKVGSASQAAAKLRAAKLIALPWFDKSLSSDPVYVNLATDLAAIDGKVVSGEDSKAKRKAWRRQVRNAVKANLPDGDEKDWDIVDKDYILPFGLIASFDDKTGKASIKRLE